MAVPKKKTSKAKSRSRRASAWRLDAPSRSLCPRCGAAKLPHVPDAGRTYPDPNQVRSIMTGPCRRESRCAILPSAIKNSLI